MQAIISNLTEEECNILKKLFNKERLLLIEKAEPVISNEENLIDFLTKTEIKALESIFIEFNNKEQGDIKVNQLTNKYLISTSVFRTLFYKLKEHKIAEIDSRGVKGTHIKFYNSHLILDIIEKNKKI